MQKWLNKNPKLIFLLGIILFLGVGIYGYTIFVKEDKKSITDFESCVESKKGIIRETYPAQCEYNGQTYIEDIGMSSDDNKNREGINLDLPENEKSQIEAWLEKNNYNQYGDSVDTMYVGGTPLFDEAKGTYIPLYEYLVNKYPDKPWLEVADKSVDKPIKTDDNSPVKSFTSVKSWLNFNDPNFELQYPDFINIASENGYPVKMTSNDGFEFVIYVDTKAPQYTEGICEKKQDVDELGVYLCYNKTTAYQEIYQRMLDSFVAR